MCGSNSSLIPIYYRHHGEGLVTDQQFNIKLYRDVSGSSKAFILMIRSDKKMLFNQIVYPLHTEYMILPCFIILLSI